MNRDLALSPLPSIDKARSLADAGDLRHALLLSFYHHLGVGTPSNEAASEQWFRAASIPVSAEYLCHLGELRERSELVNRNFVAANLAYQEAMNLDEAKGAYMLARLAMNQESSNPYKNLHSAVGYLTRAAARGHIPSQVILSRMNFRAGGRLASRALIRAPLLLIALLRAVFGRNRDALWRYKDVFRDPRKIEKYVGEDRTFLVPVSLQGVVLNRLAPPR